MDYAELYTSLIKMQDYAILSADKADSMGLTDLSKNINQFIAKVGRSIEEIAPQGIVRTE